MCEASRGHAQPRRTGAVRSAAGSQSRRRRAPCSVGRHPERRVSLADHHRQDRRFGRRELEAQRVEPVPKIGRIVPQTVRSAPATDSIEVERRAGRRRHRGREPGRVDEAARAVEQKIDQRARTRDIGAIRAERFAQRADVNVDLALEAEVRRRDPRRAALRRRRRAPRRSSPPRDTARARSTIAAQRREVAVHAEDRVGDDQAAPPGGRIRQQLAQMIDYRDADRCAAPLCSGGIRRSGSRD